MERLEKSLRRNDRNERKEMICYVPHTQIDKELYDNCIRSASNCIIYAFSWYLDIVSPGWDLLEYDNYKVVMPLPNRKRKSIQYIFTPLYIQQLGIFGINFRSDLVQEFIECIPEKFKLIELKLNEHNFLNNPLAWTQRTNNLLELNEDYETTANNFHRNCKRNIKKAIDAGLTIGESINADEFAKFIAENLQAQISGFTDNDVSLLARITQECNDREKGEIVCVRDMDGNVKAAGSFLFSNNRLIFSVCASTPVGHKQQAMYYLVAQQIKRHYSNYSYFDFSGSEIKGIAYFNSTFGAKEVSYPLLKMNRLPWLLKLLTGKFK